MTHVVKTPTKVEVDALRQFFLEEMGAEFSPCLETFLGNIQVEGGIRTYVATAKNEGKIVSALLAYDNGSTGRICDIDFLATAKDFRKGGLAKMLIRSLARMFYKETLEPVRDPEDLYLHVGCSLENLEFYQHLGFEVIQTFKSGESFLLNAPLTTFLKDNT